MSGRPKEFDPTAALSAATRLFWSRGYEASSMAMLVEEMEINRQSVYNTYGDKRSLFMDALRQYTQEVSSEIQTVLSTGDSPVARLKNFLRAISQRACSNERRGCLLTNTIVEIGPHDPEVRAFISSVLQRLENEIARLVKEAVECGECRAGTDPQRTARLILTVMQGALVLSKTDLKASLEDALQFAEQLLLPA